MTERKLPNFPKAASTSTSSRSTFSSEDLGRLKRESDYYYSCTDENEAHHHHQMSRPVYNQLTEPLPQTPPPKKMRMRQVMFDSPLQRYLARIDANTEALEKMNLDEHFVFSSPEQKLPSPSNKSIILDHVYANVLPCETTKSQLSKYVGEKDNINVNKIEATTSQSSNPNLLSTNLNNNNNMTFQQQISSYSSYIEASPSGFVQKMLSSGKFAQDNNTSPSNFPELLKELKLMRQRKESEIRLNRERKLMIERQHRELEEQEAQRAHFKTMKSLLLKCFGFSLIMWIIFLSLNIFLHAGYFNITTDKNTVEFIYFILITTLIALESSIWAVISYWMFSSRPVLLRPCLIVPLISQILILCTLTVAFAHSSVHNQRIQQSILSPILRFGVCILLQVGILIFTCYSLIKLPRLASLSNTTEIRPVSQV